MKELFKPIPSSFYRAPQRLSSPTTCGGGEHAECYALRVAGVQCAVVGRRCARGLNPLWSPLSVSLYLFLGVLHARSEYIPRSVKIFFRVLLSVRLPEFESALIGLPAGDLTAIGPGKHGAAAAGCLFVFEGVAAGAAYASHACVSGFTWWQLRLPARLWWQLHELCEKGLTPK
jgi:hypothetical protein